MELSLGIMELAGFCLCSSGFYSLLKKHQSILQSIEYSTKATVFTPGLLAKIMQMSGPKTYLKSIRNFSEGKDFSTGYAFLRGITTCRDPIVSSINKETEMILSNISTESLFSNNNKLNDSDKIIETRFVNEFKLVSLGDTTAKPVTVVNTTSVNYASALKFVDSTTLIRSLNNIEKFFSWALFCVKLFLSMSNVGKRISGFRVGSRKVESGVLMGQNIIVFGKVFFDRINKELRIDNPKYYLMAKLQLVNKLKRSLIRCSRNMILMAFLMCLCGSFFLRRIRKNVKLYLERRARLNSFEQQDKLFKVNELRADSFKCMECGREPRNIIFKPCMHMAICHKCFEKDKREHKTCPICRREVKDKVQVYVV